MGFNLSFGGTTFHLELSSSKIETSLVSTKFIANTNSCDQRDRDAIIELHDFTGTLFITHPKNNHKDNNSTKIIDNTAPQVRENSKNEQNKASTKVLSNHITQGIDDISNPRTQQNAVHKKSEFDCNEIDVYKVQDNNALIKLDEYKQRSSEKNDTELSTSMRASRVNCPRASVESVTTLRVDNMRINQAAIRYEHGHGSSLLDSADFRSSLGYSLNNSSSLSFGSSNSLLKGNISINDLAITDKYEDGSSDNMLRSSFDSAFFLREDNLGIENNNDDNNDEKCADSSSDDNSFKSHRESWISQKAYHQFRTKIRQTTHLHQACKSSNSKVQILRDLLKKYPTEAAALDIEGNLPLHLIGQNEHLLFGRKALATRFFIDELIDAYPGALLTLNDKGYLPFTTAIFNWIEKVHQTFREETIYFDFDNQAKDVQIPIFVHIDPLTELSFKYISEIYNLLENANIDIENFESLAKIHGSVQQFVSHVSRIPLLFKTCLLLTRDKVRQRLFSYTFMKRCLLMDHTVGDWLVVFLANSDTSSRAIEYFENLSTLTPNALGIGQSQVTDVTQFNEKREDVILKISKMDYILPALFMLNVNDTKRACSTYAIRRILALSMTDHSLLGILSVDLSMYLILIIAYDAQESHLLHTTANDYNETNIFRTPVVMTSIICLYIFVREEILHFMMVKSLKKMLKNYTSIWNLLQLLMLIIISVTNVFILTVGQRTPVPLIILSKSLIWINVIGFLKGTNVHLSMFISSLGRIIYGMRWFLIVMIITIFLFADMFHMVIFTENKEQCSQVDFETEHDLFSDYCADVVFRNSLRSFAILAGDVGLDDYWELGSLKVILLWVLYSFTGVIILLNVLIAIVTESYENSSSRSHSLLGIARIPILAKHSYLDTEARKLSELGFKDFRYRITVMIIASFFIIFGISYIALARAIYMDKDTSTTETSHVIDIVKIILLSIFYIMANIAMLVTVTDLLHIDTKWECCIKLMANPCTIFIFNLLGVTNKDDISPTMEDMEQDDILPAVKELIDSSSNLIRYDIQKVMMKLKKQSNSNSDCNLSFGTSNATI